MKRVHLEVVWRVTGPLLAETECELTPARFDMMRIIYLYEWGMLQGQLQKLLGVSAPTVSRMLKSLEELGMIQKARYRIDTRCRMIYITLKGKKCVEIALAAVIGTRADEHAVARAATGKPGELTFLGTPRRVTPATRDSIIAAARPHVDTLDKALERARKGLLDKAMFHHPWRDDRGEHSYHHTVDGVTRYGSEIIERICEPDWRPASQSWNPPWRLPSG